MLPLGYKATPGFMGVDCWVEENIFSTARETGAFKVSAEEKAAVQTQCLW